MGTRKDKTTMKVGKESDLSTPLMAGEEEDNGGDVALDEREEGKEPEEEIYVPPPPAEVASLLANNDDAAVRSELAKGTLPVAEATAVSTINDEEEGRRRGESSSGSAASSSSQSAPSTVRVVAPMTLSEGYTFVATLPDGRAFQVTVPPGGVVVGQTFTVSYPRGVEFLATTVIPPTGYWKDGLFACCSPGLFHPSWWCALFCNPVATAQVMTRMKLDWLATPGDENQVRSTFRIVVWLFVAYLFLDSILKSLTVSLTPNMGKVVLAIDQLLQWCFYFYVLWIITMTRIAVRHKYRIPEKNCVGCEDCCCAFWCTCCSVSQMMRHTADYETYRAVCCSPTGLPDAAPIV